MQSLLVQAYKKFVLKMQFAHAPKMQMLQVKYLIIRKKFVGCLHWFLLRNESFLFQ